MTRSQLRLGLLALAVCPGAPLGAAPSADDMRAMAHGYYSWRNEQFPAASSEQGLHTWDDRLTNYSASALRARRNYVADLAARAGAGRRASCSAEP